MKFNTAVTILKFVSEPDPQKLNWKGGSGKWGGVHMEWGKIYLSWGRTTESLVPSMGVSNKCSCLKGWLARGTPIKVIMYFMT